MRRRNLLISSSGGSDTHDFVEIGGVKWATMNIGAETETDYGLYFQWGDTAGYTSGQCGSNTVEYRKPFFSSDYKFNGGRSTLLESGMTKYNLSDGKTVLDKSDDAARLYWGGDWRMPTTAEFVALGNAVTTAWTQVDGVYGLLCTDKEDSSKTLFFPAAGDCYNSSFAHGGTIGYYWSSSLYTSYSYLHRAYDFRLDSSGVLWQDYLQRCQGFSIRPVLGS